MNPKGVNPMTHPMTYCYGFISVIFEWLVALIILAVLAGLGACLWSVNFGGS